MTPRWPDSQTNSAPPPGPLPPHANRSPAPAPHRAPPTDSPPVSRQPPRSLRGNAEWGVRNAEWPITLFLSPRHPSPIPHSALPIPHSHHTSTSLTLTTDSPQRPASAGAAI